MECKQDFLTLFKGNCYDCSENNTGTLPTECDSIVMIDPQLLEVDEVKQKFSVEVKFKGPQLTPTEIADIAAKNHISVESDFDMEVL